MLEDRQTSTPPEVKVTQTLAKAIVDIVGLLVVCVLSYAMNWPIEATLGSLAAILGLMRFKPIADKGGPLAFAFAAVASIASEA